MQINNFFVFSGYRAKSFFTCILTIFRSFILIMAAAFIFVGCVKEEDKFTNHGIAAPSGQAGWGGIVATADADGTPLIVVNLWTGVGETQTRSLLLINAKTGETEQYEIPGSADNPGFYIWLNEDRYFYTTLDEQLVAFDIHERDWFFTEEVPARFVMRFTEDKEGRLFFGMYPNGEILMFDRVSSKLTNFGPIVEEDWAQYPHLGADDTGIAIQNGRLYFSSGSELWSYKLSNR